MKKIDKNWPKVSKHFQSFLNEKERHIVFNYTKKKLDISSSFDETMQIDSKNLMKEKYKLSDLQSPYPKNTCLSNLFDKFKIQAFLNYIEVSKQRKGKTRDWGFDVRGFVLDTNNADLIFEAFWDKYKDLYPFQIAAETLAGSLTAQLLSIKAKEKGVNLNCFLVREERKATGLQKNIEGGIIEGKPIVIVDDLFNSGGTISYLLEILKQRELKIHSLFVFVDYSNKIGKNFLQDSEIKLQSFFKLSDFGIKPNKSTWSQHQIKFEPMWIFQSSVPSLCYPVPKSTPAQDKDCLYFGTDEGLFYALNKKDGLIKWSFKTGEHIQKKGIFSCPLILNNLVFFGSYDGNLYALEKETGEEKWTFIEADWIGSSPCVSKKHNLVFIGLEFGQKGTCGGIIALNSETGQKVWEDSFEDYVHCSPAYSEELDLVIIGSNCGYVRLYDALTGQMYWENKIGSAVKSSFAFDEKRGIVCFGAFDGKEYILSMMTGKIIFTYQTQGLIYSAPVVFDDILFFTSTDKNIYGIDLKTFQLRFKFLTSAKILSSPVVWKKFIVFGSNDGRVYLIDFKKKKLNYLQFSERITNRVVFDKKNLFVSLYNNEIYSLDLQFLEK